MLLDTNRKMLRPFDEYSPTQQDCIRKKGLRVLAHAFKLDKQCVKCGHSNPDHLWLSAPPYSQKLPLHQVRQADLFKEMRERTPICAWCRRLAPCPPPPYKWTPILSKEDACIECGRLDMPGWRRSDTGQESDRCQLCKAAFFQRVARAAKFNREQKLRVAYCAHCHIKATAQTAAAFDWDHLDPQEKEGNIGGWVRDGADIDVLRREIAKCRLLCVLCHLDWTAGQQGYSDPGPEIEKALEEARILEWNEVSVDLEDADESLDLEYSESD